MNLRKVTGSFAFDGFYQALNTSPLRQRITESCRTAEPLAVQALLPLARQNADAARRTQALAHKLALQLRQPKSTMAAAWGRAGLVQGLLREFALSSQEGVALMCLAEALLRIPDDATRDALIRDKIGQGDWQAHIGQSASLFVNAAAWGLLITGKLVGTHSETGLAAALKKVASRSGEPLIRKGVDLAMRMMGEQFVTGETIAQALVNAKAREAQGFRYSYDMLGEAALTADDASRYCAAYGQAIEAIGKASAGRGIYEGPGISIKLSALHPRYSRSQLKRVIEELYPRLLHLAELAKRHDIGINIDAEEADRLELSLDLLECLCFAPSLAGWNGIGFVIQAYQKRCPAVVDWLVDLGQRSGHRIMVRLVKGAYWDSEIKRAQVDGLADFPVYTRKSHTDVAFLACARKLLAAPGQVYPQFATHNTHTLAAVHHMAGKNYYAGQYEFQCLHGMGEPLYEQIVGSASDGKLGRPCRIYAPVGTHETLLAYLVRRLLENGANTSFVNRMADVSLPIDALIQDPVQTIEQTALAEGRQDPQDRQGPNGRDGLQGRTVGLPHPAIAAPSGMFGAKRANSAGLDLSDENTLAALAETLRHCAAEIWHAAPTVSTPTPSDRPATRPVVNPADQRDIVGTVIDATLTDVQSAVQRAQRQAPLWAATPPARRAAALDAAAGQLQANLPRLTGLLMREAGKTAANAVSEVREAIDFLRYYAAQVRQEFDNSTHRPLGLVVCISPWNFPLAIFAGQIAAALAAGNVVMAKPAEQTPLAASEAVRLMHLAGVPSDALQLLPGPGETIGAALTASPAVQAVVFTGSTEVARLIQRELAKRLNPNRQPVVLIAETGGQNAMLVDSSALVEQVVVDVMASAFDSAGQRCSALRVLCVQEDVADRLLTMLEGAMRELRVGNPGALAVDVGPVIDDEARVGIERHIQTMRGKGHRVVQCGAHGNDLRHGHFIPPTLIEIKALHELAREVFGPVLHVLRYPRAALDDVLEQIHATGYGLTLGLHTRIDETVQRVLARARVGNIYVNRNMVGAVVGVQPFGGEGLSGTGPKAGGPLYLLRLLSQRPDGYAQSLVAERQASLPGPTGESNLYHLHPRQAVLCLADSDDALVAQVNAVLAAGSRVVCLAAAAHLLPQRAPKLVDEVALVDNWRQPGVFFDLVLHQGDARARLELCQFLAAKPGPIVPLVACGANLGPIPLERLFVERSVSINTAAAGGNASLMSVG